MKETNLIKQYIEGKVLNIEKVMDDYTNYLYIVLKNRNLNLTNEDMEEIISDTFLAVWKNQTKLDVNKPMSSYLVGVMQNIYHKKIRNLKNVVAINEYENKLYQENDLSMQVENTEKDNLIMLWINNMKEEDKNIFILYYYYSKSAKEIADKLQITDKKVKSRLFRIRKKLRKNLERRGYCGK